MAIRESKPCATIGSGEFNETSLLNGRIFPPLTAGLVLIQVCFCLNVICATLASAEGVSASELATVHPSDLAEAPGRMSAAEFFFGVQDSSGASPALQGGSQILDWVRILDCSDGSGLTIRPLVAVRKTPFMLVLESQPQIPSPYLMHWDVQILDSAGRHIRSMGQSVSIRPPFTDIQLPGAPPPLNEFVAVTPSMTWDGRDDGGAVVPGGQYSYQISVLATYALPFSTFWALSAPLGTAFAECGLITDDEDPPIFEVLAPRNGERINTSTPRMAVAYFDLGSGIDLNSIRVLLDGVDVSGDFDLGEFGGEWIPGPAEALQDGVHEVRVVGKDRAGNSGASESVTFRTRGLGLTATPGAGEAPLAVVLEVTPEEAGAQRITWDFDGDGVEDAGGRRSRIEHLYETPGFYDATVAVEYGSGRSANQASIPIVVSDAGVVAAMNAIPVEGYAPLEVLFTPGGESTFGSIDGYRWDFDGDGTFDTPWDPFPDNKTFTFRVPGEYEAFLYMRDEVGNIARDSKAIRVLSPPFQVAATAKPNNGGAPLLVEFEIDGVGPDGPPVRIELTPGDGGSPIVLPGPGRVLHLYQVPGNYDTRVVATDAVGAESVLDRPDIDVLVGPPGAPVANIQATPAIGPAPLDVVFDVGGSFDPNGFIVLYEWDYEYEGNFSPDFSWSDPIAVANLYSTPGLHTAALRVTDSEGLTSMSVVVVVATSDPTIEVLEDTINPYLTRVEAREVLPHYPTKDALGRLSDAERESSRSFAPPPYRSISVGPTATIRTTIIGGDEHEVYVTNRSGERVRTLFGGRLSPGSYDYVWDGRDEQGMIVLDGDYYAYVDAVENGQVLRAPSGPSGGVTDFVSGTQNHSDGNPEFDPWDDEFWELTFTTADLGASEVTAWVTPFSVPNNLTATLVNRVPFGTGEYETFWAGIQDDGRFIPPRGERPGSQQSYLWSARGWSLPDNAIVVEGGRPVVSAPSVDFNYFDPTVLRCLVGEDNKFRFSLSRTATVVASVVNLSTQRTVRILEYAALGEGAHELDWDGKTEDGRFASEGQYRVDIVAQSPDGNRGFVRQVLLLVSH